MKSTESRETKEVRWLLTEQALILLAASVLWFLASVPAFVTPWGVVYTRPDPSIRLQFHEACHMDRVADEGFVNFMIDYWVKGNGKIEEARCGSGNHFIGRVPWMKDK